MKKEIKEALTKLLESPDLNSEIRFTHESKKGDKTINAKLSYKENGEPTISLISATGYSKNYKPTSMHRFFDELRTAAAGLVNAGDFILTRQLISNPPPPGTVVNLSDETYYYNVNGGLMSCNGDQLGKNFQARFIKIINARCNADSEIMAYSQFKLLQYASL
jgi:hypothetical protein